MFDKQRLTLVRRMVIACTVIGCVVIAVVGVAAAQVAPVAPQANAAPQDTTREKTFNLSTSQTAAVEAEKEETPRERYAPQIEAGKLEIGLSLGFMNLNKQLLALDRLIYKTTDDAFFYADVTINAKSAFTPVIRAAYNLNSWFALEGQLNFTFSDYDATLTNRYKVSPEGPGSTGPQLVDPSGPDAGAYDAEHRSVLGVIADLNAIVYPLNLHGSRISHWQPYLTGGVGRASYTMDSNYTSDPATAFDANLGGGIRLIADDLISLRFEIVQHFHTIEFAPSEYFDIRNSGTVKVPNYQFDQAGYYSRVTSYPSESLGSLVWSVGIVGSF